MQSFRSAQTADAIHPWRLKLLGQASWRDYYEVTKPKVVALLLLTALVGSCLASAGLPPPLLLMSAMVGIGFVASGAAAFNHLIDQRIDAEMARTQYRPLPQGRLTPTRVLIFASLLSVLGSFILLFWVNSLTAGLTLMSLVGYAGIYTLYLKRATPQNIVIGGLAGAAPPLLGWTAMTNEIHAHGLLLVMLIFIWTPPHFWALAIHRRDDYAKVNIPMLPVTHGIDFTKNCVFYYTLLLFVAGLLPYLTGMSGLLYLLGAVLLNGMFVYHAWRLKFSEGRDRAMKTFKFSIIHLMLLFLVLLVDHYLL